MKNNWQKVKLKNVASFINGRAFKETEWSSEGLPIIRIQNLTNTSTEFNYFNGKCDEKYLVKNGNVLISWSATLDIYEWSKGDAYLNQHIFKVVFDRDDVDKGFFVYAIKNVLNQMISQMHGATMKHITKTKFEAIEIPLPPLPIQKKIADALDAADEIRRKRQQTIDKLDELVQSVFTDMFGGFLQDKTTHTTLEELCGKGMYGSGASSAKFGLNEYRYLRITDIEEDGSLNSDTVSPSEVYTKYIATEGDLFFARTGATVGKSYLYDKNDGPLIFAGYLIKFSIPKPHDPYYFYYFTKTDYYKKWVENKRRIVAQPNINATEYGQELSIPLPPLQLQMRFKDIVDKIYQLKKNNTQYIDFSTNLFNSLMQRAFNGELEFA